LRLLAPDAVDAGRLVGCNPVRAATDFGELGVQISASWLTNVAGLGAAGALAVREQ